MPFKESLKKEVRRKSGGKCVLCHKPFVEIHHIIPQSCKGKDTIDNAVALCAYCHDIFGSNPTKRKQLKELRDIWYETVSANKTSSINEQFHNNEKRNMLPIKTENKNNVAIYHVIFENENFNEAARALFNLTKESIKKYKHEKRILYLDIDGHRLSDGAFDNDMWELQFNFIAQNLLFYYTEINLPIAKIINPYEQIEEEIGDEFIIYEAGALPKELEGHLITTITPQKN